MTPSRRLDGLRAYDRATDAFGVVSRRRLPNLPVQPRPWPEAESEPEPVREAAVTSLPGWLVVVGGGVVAALTGAMLGGALHI